MNWLENVKNIKKKKGLTNESLSAQSEISLGTLNKLLSGATADPKLSTLIALASGLGCSVDEMLTGVAPQETLSPEEKEVPAHALRKSSEGVLARAAENSLSQAL